MRQHETRSIPANPSAFFAWIERIPIGDVDERAAQLWCWGAALNAADECECGVRLLSAERLAKALVSFWMLTDAKLRGHIQNSIAEVAVDSIVEPADDDICSACRKQTVDD